MTIRVYKGPESGRTVGQVAEAALDHSPLVRDFAKKAVCLTFPMDASNGKSFVLVTVEPVNFASIAQAMMAVSPNEAIKAFGGALKSGVPALDLP